MGYMTVAGRITGTSSSKGLLCRKHEKEGK